jgi:hypothetical protein
MVRHICGHGSGENKKLERQVDILSTVRQLGLPSLHSARYAFCILHSDIGATERLALVQWGYLERVLRS